jgi:hypothetical protein
LSLGSTRAFRIADVRNDDWEPIFDALYPDPYRRDYAEPRYEGRSNGLFVRGAVDGTHYGNEKPPQLAMVGWFEPCRPRSSGVGPSARDEPKLATIRY